MNKYTAQGKNVEEAVQTALNALHISKEDAIINVLDEGKRGFLGIGQRDAIVSVEKNTTKEDTIEATLVDSFMSAGASAQPESKVEKITPAPAVEEVKASKPTVEKTEPTPQVKEVEVEEKQKVSEPEVVEEDNEEDNEGNIEEIEAQDQKAIADVREYIATIVDALDQKDDDVYVEVEREGSYIFYDIHSEHPGIVIGRHGKVLEAIHTLAQIYLHNEASSKLYVEVDTENYRGRRENSLRYLARESAEQAIERHQPVVIEELSAKERKVIHRILSHNNDVKTYSKGKEPDRFLVVEPQYENE